MKKLLLLGAVAFGLNSFGQVPSYVPTNGLEAWWEFNSNALDESGNNNDGTVNGASLTADRFGNSNEAYSFDGIDDYIACGTVMDISTKQAISISGWFYVESVSSFNNQYTGLSFGTKDMGTVNLRVRTDSDYLFQAQHADAGESNSISMRGDNSFYLNEWYHVVGIYADDTVSLFVNGLPQSYFTGIGNLLSSIPSSSIFKIGLSYGSSNTPAYYKGKLDDIGIWNRALTHCEVLSLYSQQICTANNIEISLNNHKEVIGIYDLMGRETVFTQNIPLIYLYDDGTRERVMKLEY